MKKIFLPATCSILISLFRGMFILTLLPIYIKTYGLDVQLYGYGIGLYFAALGITAFPGGYLSDILGRRKLMFTGWTLAAVAPFFLSKFPTTFLLPCLALAGTGFGLAAAPFHAWVADYVKRKLAITYGVVYALAMLCSAIGPLTVGLAIAQAATRVKGIQHALYLSGFIALGVALLSLLAMEGKVVTEKIAFTSHEIKIVKDFSLADMVVGIGAGFSIPYFSIFFLEKFNCSPFQLGVILSTGVAFISIGMLVCGWLGDRVDKLKFMLLANALTIPFALGIILAPTLLFSSIFYVGRMTLANMVWPLWVAFFMANITARVRGKASGITFTVWSFGYLIGSSLGGHLYATLDGWVFVITAILYLTVISYVVWDLKS